jgi:1,4-alpha-glucan branching enzyme
MYEQFGSKVDGSSVEFRLFVPDNSIDPKQYSRGGAPRIKTLRVVGDFQSRVGGVDWDVTTGFHMAKQRHRGGWLFSHRLDNLAEGFHEYRYFVEYENGTTRWVSDPCSKYGGSDDENSGFVVGGNTTPVHPIKNRRPLSDLVLYELMIDDFTAEFRGERAPLDAVRDKLDHLQHLGVNAIAFMPWTAWLGEGFSWGYDPFAFFSVEHRYYHDPSEPLDKLFRLQRLINEMHDRDLHVIMDGVFNHANVGTDPNRGFGYHWLYENPEESPYTGAFEQGGFFEDLDFSNACTAEFIVDACKYWLKEFAIDGIRFDYVKGFFETSPDPIGITRIIRDLKTFTAAEGLQNISFILEFLTDNRYEAIERTNAIGATGCWYDPLMFECNSIGRSGNISTSLVRALNSGKDCAAEIRPVTYIENHDHSTIAEQCGGRSVWWRSQPLVAALFTVSGAAMIHNGQEFGNQYWFPEDGEGRVMPRPVRWADAGDATGQRLIELYRKLIQIRLRHPALRSLNFYPEPYDVQQRSLNPQGYGVDEGKDVAIFHRWGTDDQGRLERFIIVLNGSAFDQQVDIPFSENGEWKDLLNDTQASVTEYWLRGQTIGSHWARVYRQQN